MTRGWSDLFAVAVVVAATSVVGVAQQDTIEELRAKAEQAGAAAHSNLGMLYADGRGVPQDHVEAARMVQVGGRLLF